LSLLVIGRTGQVAQALAATARRSGFEDLRFTDRSVIDLLQPESARRAIFDSRPELVVIAAAYTAVDRAENERDAAMRINGDAVGEVAAAAAEVGAPVIHLSTDYVFDGSGEGAYRENDTTCPVNFYGASKLAGEEALRAAQVDHLILRTSWVYAPTGTNFVKTMLRLAADREEVRVVADQRGCPSSAGDLADAILGLALKRLRAGSREGWGETYHLAGQGVCSWAEFAGHVFEQSRTLGGPHARVVPIPSSEYPTPARRPANSELDCGRIAQVFGVRPLDWRRSSSAVVAELLDGSGSSR
jgi:dTDP-4-dehydrorhamnose reductase